MEMDVQQGLPKPLSLGKPLIFGSCKPNSRSGGWTRTSNKGLMSSWLSSLWVIAAIRSSPAFGENKPRVLVCD